MTGTAIEAREQNVRVHLGVHQKHHQVPDVCRLHVCYRGNQRQYPCDRTEQDCPPCRLMEDHSCYEFLENKNECPDFDNIVDCSKYKLEE